MIFNSHLRNSLLILSVMISLVSYQKAYATAQMTSSIQGDYYTLSVPSETMSLSFTAVGAAATTENGVCSTTANECAGGDYSSSPADTSTQYKWTCLGKGSPKGTDSGTCTATIPTTPTVVWTNYCTGGSDINGNNWQIWAYDNSDPRNYKYVEPGTVTNGCVATVPAGNGSCSSPSAHYTCTSPTASTNNVNGTSAYTWTCPGTGTGTGASCTEDKAVPPTCVPDGSCSAATPACETTTTGIDNCGSCSKTGDACSPPPPCVPGSGTPGCCVPNAGQHSCYSSTNSCNERYSGEYTIDCDGTVGACSVDVIDPPPDPDVTATISAVPNRVKATGTTQVSWTTIGATSCTIKKNGSFLKELTDSSGNPSVTCDLTTPPSPVLDNNVTTQSIYTIDCSNNVNGDSFTTSSNIVNVVPNYGEF